MLRLATQPLGTKYSTAAGAQSIPANYVKWQIYWYHRSGGLKKLINIGQESTNIYAIEFENNEYGCGVGKISFAYVDFPIDYDDMVQIYYQPPVVYVTSTTYTMAQTAHTITRESGSFIVDGWVIGMAGTIRDSGSNNGASFTVTQVADLAITVSETLNVQSKAQTIYSILKSSGKQLPAVLKYTGIVEQIPDAKGGDVGLIPMWTRTKERLVDDVNRGAITIDINNNKVTLANHAYVTADAIWFEGSGVTLPTPLVLFVNYYVIPINSSTFYLAATSENAYEGNKITLGGSTSGTINLHSPIKYTAQTIFAILKDLFVTQVTDTGILWSDARVVTGSVATYTASYSYQTLEKIINDMIGKLTNVVWGVDPDNYFFVRARESTVSAQLYYSDNPPYSDIAVETDTSGIYATRYEVFAKNTTGSGTVHIGDVGSGGSYPILPIENLYRKKQDKLTIPDGITQADALAYAYALLQSYQALRPITVNNVQIDSYQPAVGRYITVQDHDDYILNTLLSCDSITGWTNASLDNTYYVEGTGSLKFTAAVVGDYMEYAFNQQIYINKPQKIGFMVRSSAAAGLFLSVKIYSNYNSIPYSYSDGIYTSGAYGIGAGTGNGQVETILINTLNISSTALWFYFDFPLLTPITRIKFEVTSAPSQTTTINIDRIQVYQTYAQTYTSNIVQINYLITPENENITMKLNTVDRAANKAINDFTRQINALNSVISA